MSFTLTVFAHVILQATAAEDNARPLTLHVDGNGLVFFLTEDATASNMQQLLRVHAQRSSPSDVAADESSDDVCAWDPLCPDYRALQHRVTAFVEVMCSAGIVLKGTCFALLVR